ncbi:kinase-like domain-containing protein [Collybia nuda]|uniref:Kinase-like domain-containing protein n=1 Tax=Collybia nuda TaxID=64659 RepID=A0A9P5YIQ9_9AGAR|nr:kinase-like domain-containing protein [Collybia nuda]
MSLAPVQAPGLSGDVTNGLETYSIAETIAANGRCTVYRVICRSGRLRNRELALKKVSNFRAEYPPDKDSPSPSIHQTLHHPNIVSLFSSFSSLGDEFHVFELCSAGTLQNFLNSRDPRRLTENETRGVVKSIYDALSYLKKELVVHRDIKPSNIMLTSDYGIKLSGFQLSTRLYSIDPKVSFVLESYSYTAPEALSDISYGFAADVWSMGCVMVTCLSGTPPFKGKTKSEVLERISLSEYKPPAHHSSDTKTLIEGLLQFVRNFPNKVIQQPTDTLQLPENRIPLPNISSHPFLVNPAATITPLRPTKETPPSVLQHKLGKFQIVENTPLLKKDLHHYRQPANPPFKAIGASSTGRARVVLRDIINTELRVLLQNELATNIPNKKSHSVVPERRVVSEPLPSSKGLGNVNPICTHPDDAFFPVAPLPPLPNRILVTDLSCGSSKESSGHEHFPPFMAVNGSRYFKCPTISSSWHNTTFAFHNCAVELSDTQDNVWPDFRESQRRKGLKGDEVFVVDPSGVQISVYSAPHLSSPCCLVEPTQQFSLLTLPSSYWKQYNDAGRLIEQIKQRTPKLVLYTTSAKCTLMANSPQGDIEVLFGGNLIPGTGKGKDHDKGNKGPFMRIRLSRQGQAIELAQYLSGVRGEEWTKTSLPAAKEPPYVAKNDWSSLNEAEQEAMNHLAYFVRKCEALELLDLAEDANTTTTDHTFTALETPVASHLRPTVRLCPDPKISSTLSSFNLTPRPKLSTIATSRLVADSRGNDTIRRMKQTRVGSTDSLEINFRKRLDGIELPTAWLTSDHDMMDRDQGIQTRFISSTGWCIRYPSSVSQGGRYRIMFLDGVALEIDVDEDWVEFRSRSGDTTRHKIRECNSRREIGERMKVFEEFVSLFDDGLQQPTT